MLPFPSAFIAVSLVSVLGGLLLLLVVMVKGVTVVEWNPSSGRCAEINEFQSFTVE